MPELTHQFDELGYEKRSGILSPRELDMLREEMDRLIASAPDEPGSDRNVVGPVDHHKDFAFLSLDDGHSVLQRISNQLARSPVMRIAYANPALLALVDSVYGREWVPFAESIIVKLPENGAEIAWHQDGTRYDVEARGLNVGIYLHDSNESNGCLRVVPGSHRLGKIDVHGLREQHGPVLPDSVPLELSAGDVSLHDRSLIHGSLTNTSPDLRITVYFGFHKLASVQPIHDPDHIRRRAQAVTLCIHERQASGLFPDERPYDYALSDLAPLPPANERAEILRTPALGI